MNRYKLRALRYYASRGRCFQVQSLVNEGVDLDGKSSYGKTALMMATRYSRTEVVEFLINSGANIHCCDNGNWTVLHHGACKGSVEVVECLLKNGVALDVKKFDGQTPLMMAALMSRRDIFELLYNAGADIHCSDDEGWTVLHHAARAGSVETVQRLLNKGAALDVKSSKGLTGSRTPLMVAAVWEHREVFELLMNSGADVFCCDEDGKTVLHHVSFLGWVEIIKCLVNKGVVLDKKSFQGITPLVMAGRGYQNEVVKLLINLGADIHCCDNNGWTALHHFVDEGTVETVKHLVNRGIAIDKKNCGGKTPLHFAIMGGRIEIADYLLKAGADCNVEDNMGKSPFNYLFKKKKPNVETIRLCIEKGAYVKSTDYNKLFKVPLLKEVILQDVKLCSQSVINKFNNKDLLLLYNELSSAQKLPHIDKMKIKNGSGMALGVEQAVAHEIQSKGVCNLFKMVPFVLGMLCVKSVKKSISAFNQSESQNGFKRLGSCNKQEYPCKKLCK